MGREREKTRQVSAFQIVLVLDLQLFGTEDEDEKEDDLERTKRAKHPCYQGLNRLLLGLP